MQVQLHLTLDLPKDQQTFQDLLTVLDQQVTRGVTLGQDRVTGGLSLTQHPTPVITIPPADEPAPVTEPDPEPAPPMPAEPPKRRPHRAVNPATLAAKAAKPAPAPDASGLADSDDETPDLNGPGDPDDEDALGLATPSMTPGEALEMGLGKVREIYAKGHKGPVKELQQKLGIAKFTDIPPAEGHTFLGLVIKLEEQVGMRV